MIVLPLSALILYHSSLLVNFETIIPMLSAGMRRRLHISEFNKTESPILYIKAGVLKWGEYSDLN